MTCILQQQQSKRGRQGRMDGGDAIKVVSAVCDSDKGNSFRKGKRSPTLLRKTNSDREGAFSYDVNTGEHLWKK